MSNRHAKSWKAVLLDKTSHFLVIFAYLWLLLSVYALHNSIVLSDWHLIGHILPDTLKALIFTKFILIGEHLHLGRRWEHKPLIWPVLVKAALFALMLMGFDYLEAILVHTYWPNRDTGGAGAIEATDLRSILSFSFMIFVALIPFFGIGELSKVMGRDKLRHLFFGSRSA